MRFGTFLKTAREIRKLSIRDVEKKSGVSNQHICQIENRHISNAGFLIIVKLARALKVPISRVAEAALKDEKERLAMEKKED